MGPSGNEQPHHGWARYDLWPVSHVLYPLIPRSRASGVTRDEATSGASWFSERSGASSGDGAFAPPHHEGYQLALHRLGEIGKELVGQFLGRAVDQALAELGQLAADLRLDIIGEQRAAILVR